jgi:shikimate dehydrogenase
LGSKTGIIALSFEDAVLADHCRACDLIVNTSSVGLRPGDPPILTSECLKPGHLVYDTIYQPSVTPLLALAMESGCRTANGLSMLLHQGVLAYRHWFPGSDPLPVMRAALAWRNSTCRLKRNCAALATSFLTWGLSARAKNTAAAW